MIPSVANQKMAETFSLLPAFLQKVAEAVTTLPSMCVEEKSVAIDFLKMVLSNCETDLQTSMKAEPSSLDHSMLMQRDKSSNSESPSPDRPRQPGSLIAAINGTPTKLDSSNDTELLSEWGIDEPELVSLSELVQDIVERPDRETNWEQALTVNSYTQGSHLPRQCPNDAQRRSDVVGETSSEESKEDDGDRMSPDICHLLPIEYSSVFVIDDDFLEEEDDSYEPDEKSEKNNIDSVIDLSTSGTSSSTKVMARSEPSTDKIHSTANAYTCGICPKYYGSLKALRNHEKLHNRPYTCSVCSASYARINHLKAHERKHTGETPFPCPNCGIHMRTKLLVTLHIQKNKCKPKINPKVSPCSDINKNRHEHADAPKVKTIVKTGHERPQCQKKNIVQANDHFSIVHKQLTEPKRYMCDECGKTFAAKRPFFRHILYHKPLHYDCHICPAKFFLKSSLEAHLQTHSRIRQSYVTSV